MMAKNRVVVLGAGRIGATIAKDLATDPALETTVVDVSEVALATLAKVPGLQCQHAGADETLKSLRKEDIVVNALPSARGLGVVEALATAGGTCVDIAFTSEDAAVHNSTAIRSEARIVYDCGVAPGISNLLVGWAAQDLDSIDCVDIAVGGIPAKPEWPFYYKAPFAPEDVIEEYTRPARFKRNGRLVEMEALSEVEPIHFPGVGTLEAFNTDGCRSLLNTIDSPNIRERTIRYPGHAELMRVFRHTGLFGELRRAVEQQLFPLWKLEAEEADLTVMHVRVAGRRAGSVVEHAWELVDRYDSDTKNHSMARTTGFPAAIVARLLARGDISEPGVYAPEKLWVHKGFILDELAKRGVLVHKVV